MFLFSKTHDLDQQAQLSTQRLSTRSGFFGLGFATASWAPLIPLAQQRLNFDHADFGLLLLCAGLGAMIAMPATGKLIKFVGCRVPIALAFILLAILLPCLAFWMSPVLMAVSLFLFGTAAGALGVALNIQAVTVEKNSGRLLMSNFHGMGSLGGLAGVMGVTALLALHVPSMVAAFAVSVTVLVICALAVRFALQQVEQQSNDGEQNMQLNTQGKRPHPMIIMLSIACFILFMTEGAAMDWGGIYLTHDFKVNATLAGLAYSFFAICMTLGRFSGSRLVHFFGEKSLLSYSVICATSGLMMVSFAPEWWVVLVGYAFVGLGCSNIVPIMFSRAGRQNYMSKTAAMSFVSTVAYTGILVGPALIGIFGQWFGLSTVFLALSFMVFAVIFLNRLTHQKNANTPVSNTH